MLKAAGVTAAGVGSRAGVDAELQPLAVNVVRNRLDTVRELVLVGNKPAVLVALLFAPAVVDNNVLIARVL